MINSKKKIAFWFITLVFPFVLIGVLECILYIFNPDPLEHADNGDPFLKIDSPRSLFSTVENNGQIFYRVTHPEAYRGRNILFPLVKEKKAIRIFCLGGSASAGWPHPPSEIYSEYLRQALQRSYPDHAIEIFNVSAHAFASYRVRYIFDEVINYNPDLLIIYTGNNEFLEMRNYSLNSSLLLKLYVLRDWLGYLRSFRYFEQRLLEMINSHNVLSGKGVRTGNFNILYSKVEKLVLDLRKDPYQYQQVQEHFRFNIDYMAKKANEKQIPTLLLTVPVNLRDWKPNVSYNRLSDNDLVQWKETFRLGEKRLIENNYDKAIQYFKKAIEQEPLHAESYFYLGRAYELKGHHQIAYENYVRARDLDYNPFRAISNFNDIIRETATRYKNVNLVDLDKIFTEASSNGLPGFDLILDYVHPTKKGNLIIAKAVYDKIIGSNIFNAPSRHTRFQYQSRPFYYNGEKYSEEKDIKLQIALLYLSGAMHQYDGLINKAKLINRYYTEERDLMLEDIQTRGEIAKILRKRITREYDNYRRKADKVIEIFPKYQEIQRKEILGIAVDPQEKKNITYMYRDYYSTVKKGVSPMTKSE
jgi:lysophospholipase L1-like esterase